MRGIYENPSLFNGHIFSYDESAYAVEISTTLKEKSDTGNMLTLHLSCMQRVMVACCLQNLINIHRF